jgi:hypothetical protein
VFLPEPGGIVFPREGRQGLLEFFDSRKMVNPEQLLLERAETRSAIPLPSG